MKRNIIEPDIAIKFSLKAYLQAAKEFNKKQEELFKNGSIENLPATVKSLLLKETHHQVFYILINYYREKILSLNDFFNGSSNIMTYISPKMSMYVKTGRIAAHIGRSNNTIRERLRRLEKAGIIKVVFHGHKKPLEIIFEKNTCLVFDKKDILSMPKSKFLKNSSTECLYTNSKKLEDKESTFSRTKYNNTITLSDVLHNENYTKPNNLKRVQYDLKNTKKIAGTTLAGTTKTDSLENDTVEMTSSQRDIQNFSETVETAACVKERKKVLQKKERTGRTVKEIREARFKELKEKAILRQMNDSERKQHTINKKEQYKLDRSNELKKRKTEALIHYSLEFFAYLMSALFSDKHLTPFYRTDTLNYISKHYFAKANSITQMENMLKNYKNRIDISKAWVDKFKTPEGNSFDTTFFYPKAYLDIEKTYSKAFSFVNTSKFIEQEKEWKKINGYNRKMNKTLKHKFNKIAREIENGFIDYDTAHEKVKSLTNKSDEYEKQLNARYFGVYKTMKE